MKKQKMIRGRAPEGLAAKEPSYEERVAAAMGASADTAATAVERAEMEAFILRDWQRKAARFDEIKGKLLADAEKDPLSALRWADDAARDLAEAARWMITRPRERVALVGWSEGAGLAVLAAASPDNKRIFSGAVTFGLSDTAVLGWRLRDDETYITHKDPDEPMFHAGDYLGEVAPLPFFMIESSADQFVSKSEAETLFAEAGEPKQYKVVDAADHGFSGNHEGLFEALREGLAWITQTPG